MTLEGGRIPGYSRVMPAGSAEFHARWTVWIKNNTSNDAKSADHSLCGCCVVTEVERSCLGARSLYSACSILTHRCDSPQVPGNASTITNFVQILSQRKFTLSRFLQARWSLVEMVVRFRPAVYMYTLSQRSRMVVTLFRWCIPCLP